MAIKNISLPLNIDVSRFVKNDLTRTISVNLSRLSKIRPKFLLSYIGLLKERTAKRIDLSSAEAAGKRVKFSPEKFKKALRLFAVIIAVVLVVFLGSKAIKGIGNLASGENAQVKDAKARQEINKEFAFPLKNSKGEKLGEVKYLIESAELRDEVVYQGKRATAVKGRIFLVFTIKIKNDYKDSIEMDTTDYVRLSVNGNEEEWLAPDFNNDPVKVQAISTKPTRVGFTINETDKNMLITVGEIDGHKERIALSIN